MKIRDRNIAPIMPTSEEQHVLKHAGYAVKTIRNIASNLKLVDQNLVRSLLQQNQCESVGKEGTVELSRLDIWSGMPVLNLVIHAKQKSLIQHPTSVTSVRKWPKFEPNR